MKTYIISIEKQSWYGIGLAHVFELNSNNSHAVKSIPINTKEELKSLKKEYGNCKHSYQK